MEFKGTKGKWKVVKNSCYFDVTADYEFKEGNSILCVSSSLMIIKNGIIESNSLSKECEANAKLIAAAPEMLEILERVQRINNIAREHISECLFEDIEQLIKKATL